MSAAAPFSEPLIPGFFPDPTVCSDGTHYWLANSSFEYFPGAPLWRSADFASWEFVGNILTRRSQFAVGDGRRSGGVFGSTLRHHDGRFWFITTNMSEFGRGHTLVTTTDPTGEWSDPVFIPDAFGIDPDLAWTDDGRCLLTWCGFGFGDGGGSAIVQAELDTETGALLEAPRVLWSGTGLAFTEGPHLVRHGEFWHLFVAEGGTASGHAVSVARSRQPEGPFEPHPHNPVLTNRSTSEAVQNIGHADLVQGPDGAWRAVLLGVRPSGITPGFHVLGRETFAADVRWDDDWPVFTPITPAPALTSFSDDFTATALDARWVSPGDDPADGGPRCTRVRDHHWDAELTLTADASATFELRIDADHSYAITLDGSVVRAVATIGPLRQEFDGVDLSGGVDVPGGDVLLRISSRPHPHAGMLGANHGPDAIHLAVQTGGRTHELATLDGRYISTEVAGGFTGRVLCIGTLDPSTPARFEYRGVAPAAPLG